MSSVFNTGFSIIKELLALKTSTGIRVWLQPDVVWRKSTATLSVISLWPHECLWVQLGVDCFVFATPCGCNTSSQLHSLWSPLVGNADKVGCLVFYYENQKLFKASLRLVLTIQQLQFVIWPLEACPKNQPFIIDPTDVVKHGCSH